MRQSDVDEILEAFKLTCRRCGGEDVVMSAEEGRDYGGQTGYSPGQITIGCNECKQNDISIWG